LQVYGTGNSYFGKVHKLDETGKFWTCVNKAGNELKWRNQLTNKLVNVAQEIETAILKGGSKGWETEVARELSKYDELTDFNNDAMNISTQKRLEILMQQVSDTLLSAKKV
jgi:hypothetical protein